MSTGRTSRLYRSLVRDQKLAAQAAGISNFPGNKYPHLFVYFAIPTPGHTPAELRGAIHKEIARLKKRARDRRGAQDGAHARQGQPAAQPG